MANVFTPSEQRLTDLLNITNLPPKLFDNTRLTYGTPEAVTGQSGYDTQVLATAIPGMGYYGDQMVYYTRIQLSVLAGQVNLYDTDPFTLDKIVSMLNGQYDTFLTTADLQAMTIPPLSAGQFETITLVADPTSIGWQGQVDIVITYGKPQLPAVIGSRSLNVLKWPDYPYRNGLEFMWNIDFTSYRDALKPKQYAPGTWYTFWGFTDYEAIADICHRLGVPWFPAPQWNQQIADYATSAVQGANTAFDRVVVMGPIQGGLFSKYDGYMYFHYNNFDKA